MCIVINSFLAFFYFFPYLLTLHYSYQVDIIYRVGQKKKNAHKTETFLLFGKIVKKLTITGISIINSIITQ